MISTSTLTCASDARLGAEIVGPGIGPLGKGGRGDGDGGGEFGTRSYLLTNFHDRYFLDCVKYGGEVSIREGCLMQSSTAKTLRHIGLVGLHQFKLSF